MRRAKRLSVAGHAQASSMVSPATRYGTSRTASIAAVLLFISGAAALVFQVLWIKQLSLVVGVEVHAITAAISAFFAGLGFGGWALGRIADRMARPVRFYAFLEVAVAILAVAATLMLARIAPAFAVLEAKSAWLPWPLVFALIGIPAFLMGGTLPALMRAIAPREGEIGIAGGRLYAANTAGAILGALLPPFLLTPAFGVQGAALAAAALNIVAAAGAFGLDRALPSPKTLPGSKTEQRAMAAATQIPATLSRDARLTLALYSVAGGIALGYEVVWSQAIVQFISTRAFAFSVVLATYLAGLVLGAAVFARIADRVRHPVAVFGILIAAAGLVSLVEIALLGPWIASMQSAAEAAVLGWTSNELAGMCARFAVAAACIVLVPTALLGAAFPLALRLVVTERHVGRDVGAVVAFNTLGGIAGSLVTGFVLVPALGLVRTLAVLALAAAAIGLTSALRGPVWRPGRWAIAGIASLAVVAAVATPSDRLADLLTGSRRGTLTYYEEAQGGTVAVIEQSIGQNRFRRLYIHGVSNSGDAMPSLRYMRLQALLPLVIHQGEPRSALVIGFGTGITAGAMLRYPTLEKRVVAELLPAVVRAAPNFVGNYGAGADQRLEIRMQDGRRELLRSEERYDLVTLEPPPPAAAGVVNLYSRDFYELAAQRLNGNGIVAQWLPLGTQNDEDTQSLVRSFLDVFPHASLWTTDFHEMLLVGSLEPLPLDAGRIAQRIAQPEVAESLREVGVPSAAALLATWVTDRAGLERYAGAALPVTDDRPRIEYGAWIRRGEFLRVLPKLLTLKTEPPLADANPALLAAIARERDLLMTFYEAGQFAQNGDRVRWSRNIARLAREDGDNPYYRWFTGGPRR
jgi:spermidine synthase